MPGTAGADRRGTCQKSIRPATILSPVYSPHIAVPALARRAVSAIPPLRRRPRQMAGWRAEQCSSRSPSTTHPTRMTKTPRSRRSGSRLTAWNLRLLEMPVADGLDSDDLPRRVDQTHACPGFDPADHCDRQAELRGQSSDALGGIGGCGEQAVGDIDHGACNPSEKRTEFDARIRDLEAGNQSCAMFGCEFRIGAAQR